MKCRTLPVAFVFALVVSLMSAGITLAQPITADFSIPGGRFYAQAAGGTPNGTGFEVTDAAGVPMWTWFQRYGAVGLLGYPNTGRFTLDGFNVQGTQRVLLQWRPESGTMAFVNIFDRMHAANLDNQLQSTYQIPPQVDNTAAEAGINASTPDGFKKLEAIRGAWLDFPNPAFKNFYLADPYHVDHYGLPTSHIVDFGPFLTIRLQRVAMQLWKVDGPAGIKAGQLVLVLGSDIAKGLNFYPSTATTPAAASVPVPPPAPRLTGVQYGFDAHAIDGQQAQAVAGVQDAGFHWVSQQVRWCDIQPAAANPPDWSQLDSMANDAAAGGLNVMFSVVCAPSWASVANGHFPARASDLATFMGALATHFKGRVQAYEIWNEENFAREVGPGNINAGNFVELLRASYPAIKQADSGAVVIAGAPTPTGVNDPNVAQDDLQYLSNMYAYQNGVVKQFFDVLGAHPEGYGNPPDQTVFNHTAANFADHPSFFFRRAEDYHNLMVQVSDNKPIWATETGYDSNPVAPAGYEYAHGISEAQQAQWLGEEFAWAKANWPWMGVMFVWNLNFQAVVPPADEKWGFSALHPDYTPRPAYTALQAIPK